MKLFIALRNNRRAPRIWTAWATNADEAKEKMKQDMQQNPQGRAVYQEWEANGFEVQEVRRR